MKSTLLKALKAVFSNILYIVLAVSLSFNLLTLYYLIFSNSTTFTVFFSSNNAFYTYSSIALAIINSVLFGIAVSMLVYTLEKKRASSAGGGGSFLGAVFGAVSASCPVCGSILLPMLGIAGSLAAFPLQGLEVRAISVLLLLYAIWETSKAIAGIRPAGGEKLLSWDKNRLVINMKKGALIRARGAIVLGTAVLVLYLLPKLPSKYKLSFTSGNGELSPIVSDSSSDVDTSSLFAQVNPKEGYTVNASFGDLGPRLISAGAIDFEKFKQTYERSGKPLTEEQVKILTEGSSKKITISGENSYFLINFLWALGLANKNPILDEGPMTKYGPDRIGSFASTGGWTIGAKKAVDIYSKSRLILLTPEQQGIVEEAANGTYRPCCGNSTAFPDCNHGMAMLGLYELMASQGASVEELFEAGKYFNAFWFPQQYLDIATYFEAKEGVDFKGADPRAVVSGEFSSGKGWTKTKKWLAEKGLIEKAPGGGGGCGV